ncbi:extracellular solute-binding protein [Fundicoccus culcitae]|uniref:Extracellular solute-binding protein n=1 Tax=Fundicoccus culcitae TaxID=2969821 RepID=A0ABY5P5D5_9LACT|nr:extracellular solute-binding protein [Fundicoccus culcitae]UUX33781.1 extracellular solute-binding protein [Fundicoccus culcitae]
MKKGLKLSIIFSLLINILLLFNLNSISKTQAQEKIKIEFWYGLTGFLGETVQEKIDTFNASQDKYEVIGVSQGDYSESYQKLQGAIASGKAPGVVLLDDYQFIPLAQRQVLMPLDELLTAHENAQVDDFVDVFWQQSDVNGQHYGIPTVAGSQIFYYRKDIFEEANISSDVMNDWETFYEAVKELTLKDDNGNVERWGWMPMWGSYNLIDSALSNGASYLSEDGRTVTINSPEWVESWDYFRKAIFDDEIMTFHHGGQGWEYWYRTIDDVHNGLAAGYIGSSGDGGDLDFDIIGAHVQPGWKGEKTKAQTGAGMMVVPMILSDEEKAAAVEWMLYFTNTENTADWAMKTGYVPVRDSVMELEYFQQHLEKNTALAASLEQTTTSTITFYDPTGGEIHAALEIAADQVMIENIPAQDALDEAQVTAQNALDDYYADNE